MRSAERWNASRVIFWSIGRMRRKGRKNRLKNRRRANVQYYRRSGRSAMCTCIAYKNKDFYFGRNLDLDCSFGEQVVVTPRNFSLEFRNTEWENRHYAMIGMASADDRFPLYAEAVNEKGLCMAGLNFPG